MELHSNVQDDSDNTSVNKILEPTKDDYERKLFSVRYSSALDHYKFSDGREIPGWRSSVSHAGGIERKVGTDSKLVCLSLEPDTYYGEAVWEVAIHEDHCINQVNVRFGCSSFKLHEVHVTLDADYWSYHTVKTDGEITKIKFNDPVLCLRLAAQFSRSGQGIDHSTLFPQNSAFGEHSDNGFDGYPFEITCYLDDNYDSQPVNGNTIIGKIIQPSTEDYAQNKFVFRYSPFLNIYQFGHDNKEAHGWAKCVYQYQNMFRKVEYDWHMFYLARNQNEREPDQGSIEWKFATTESYVFRKVDIKFSCAKYENAKVDASLSANGACHVIKTNGDVNEVELGSSVQEVTISAHLSGGVGEHGWQHAQLFRQNQDAGKFPFEVCFYLDRSEMYEKYTVDK